ncbi:mCG1025989 [Mus musculus]|nr:mCG1025989 [Mus musculus]
MATHTSKRAPPAGDQLFQHEPVGDIYHSSTRETAMDRRKQSVFFRYGEQDVICCFYLHRFNSRNRHHQNSNKTFSSHSLVLGCLVDWLVFVCLVFVVVVILTKAISGLKI